LRRPSRRLGSKDRSILDPASDRVRALKTQERGVSCE
jgi:hypothetical protein